MILPDKCVHGRYSRCDECEAEGDAIVRVQRKREWAERGLWFMFGALSMMLIEIARTLWLAP